MSEPVEIQKTIEPVPASSLSSSESSAASVAVLPREWLTLLGLSTLPVICVLACCLGSGKASLQTWASRSDLMYSVAVTEHIVTGDRPENRWAERLFPGWPILCIPAAISGYPLAGAVGLAAVFASAVPFLVLWLTRSLPIAYAAAVFPPVWILQSTMGMSEPAYLAFVVAAIAFAVSGRVSLAAVLMGLAALIRPTALFPWCAVLVHLLITSAGPRKVATWVLLSGFIAGAVIPLNVYLYDEPFRQLNQYLTLPNLREDAQAAGLAVRGAGHFGWPFQALLETPLLVHVPTWKIGYVWFHVVLVVVASTRVFWFKSLDAVSGIAAVWAVANSLFIVCAGPYWGFHSFDRYCLWAMPAYLVLIQKWLPSNRFVYMACAVFSTVAVICVKWNQLTG